jgi:hypothetical protein
MFWKKLFRRKQSTDDDISLTPEYIETLPASDDATFYKNSKRLLQRFDEYITAAEAESEQLSIELDGCIEQQDTLEDQLKDLNKPDSWHERHLLLKLDRLQLHSQNLMQRIEIYSQNIKIYLNLISKIQDIKAMRLNGLDENKIETIWIEFRETLDQYRNRVMTEEVGFHNEPVTTRELETRIDELKGSLFPQRNIKEKPAKAVKEPAKPRKTTRKSIEDLLEEKKLQQGEALQEDEYDEEEDQYEAEPLLE